MKLHELAELQRLAPAPGRVPSREYNRETILMQLFGYVEQLPDRTLRLTNKGMDAVTRHRIALLRSQ